MTAGTVRITLTPHEMCHADGIYADWQEMNQRNGCKPRYGAAKNLRTPYSIHAQIAVANYCNLYHYENTGNYSAVDVGHKVQVRSITERNRRLILHKEDNSLDPFVLVFCAPPDFELLGWMLAGTGKDDRYWCNPRGDDSWAFFVPQGVLWPMETLLVYLHPHEHGEVRA